MAGVLIYSDNTSLAMELLTAARLIAKDQNKSIKALTVNNPEQAEKLAAKGADTYRIQNPDLTPADTAAMASALQQAAEKLDGDIVLLSSNRRGKELAGRLAEGLGAGCLTDVKSINTGKDGLECVRNILGGATVGTQRIITVKKIIALSPKAYPAAEQEGVGSLQDLEVMIQASKLKLVETREKAGENVDLEAAEILVVVGQGVEKQEQLADVAVIAEAINGVVACSKPVATDRKWFGEERIIGLSGKICKPELAILLGISGQVQFAVGIREAKTIVSVNKDENAIINKMSDYVLVADLNDVIPAFKNALGK